MSKNKISRLLLIVWVIISIILLFIQSYGIINLLVSYKYTPSEDLFLTINIIKEFAVYLLLSIIIIIISLLIDRDRGF
jgi:hypothetical protein